MGNKRKRMDKGIGIVVIAILALIYLKSWRGWAMCI